MEKEKSKKVKWLLCLFVCFCFMQGSYGQSAQKRMTLNRNNISLVEVLNAIKAQTGYMVFANTQLLEGVYCNIHKTNATVDQILKEALKGHNLQYKFENNTIVIAVGRTTQQAFRKAIQGKVIDKSGHPLPGANIRAGKDGCISDIDGNFYIEVPESIHSLEVSFVGMKRFLLNLTKDKFDYIVVLEDASGELDEVVVTGYSNVRRSDYVGAANVVKMDDIRSAGVTQIDNMLQGVIPGVVVTQPVGQTGSTPKVRVRGTSTLLGNQAPLWVVDGVIQRDPTVDYNNDNYFSYATDDSDLRTITANAISWLNPNDVESITVLKDASATAIYGSAAANGVIVVTTKKAGISKATVNYSGDFTIGLRPSYGLYDRMNSNEMMQFSMENYKNHMQYPTQPLNIGFVGIMQQLQNKEITEDEFNAAYIKMAQMNTDWFDLLFRNSFNQSHNLSISGGTENIQTRASLGYTNQKGDAKGNNLTQYSVNTNTTIRFPHNIVAAVNLKANRREVEGYAYGVDPFSYAYGTSRVIGAFDENGDYIYHTKYGSQSQVINQLNTYNYNILNEIDNTGQRQTNSSFGTSIDLIVPIISGLQYKGMLSYDYANTAIKSYATEKSYYITQIRGYEYGQFTAGSDYQKSSPLPNGGVLHTEDTNTKSYVFRSDLIFDKLYNDTHRITLQGGMELRSSDTQANYNTTYGYKPDVGESFASVPLTHYQYANTNYAYENSLYEDMRNAKVVINRTNNYLSGYFFGVYGYKNRYITNISARIDASNRFGQDQNKKYQPTWSVAGKWRIKEEAFMQNVKWMDMLDVSASFGYQGNSVESVSPYLIARMANFDNYLQQYTMSIKSLPYPDLGWEKTRSFNAGIEASFLNNRFNVNFNYYHKSSDVLSSHDVPYENGVENSVVSGVQMRNEGYELIVNVIPIQTEDWTWQVSVNTSRTKNELTHTTIINSLYDYLNGTAVVNGAAYSTLYSFKFKGLDPNNGTPLFDLGKEADGETDFKWSEYHSSKITENPLDYLVDCGTMEPDFSGGFNTQLRYKNWRLYAQFSMLFGGVGRLPSLFNYDENNGVPYPEQNMSRQLIDRWQKSGDEQTTNIPSVPGIGTTQCYLPSEFNIFNPYELYYYSDLRIAKTDMIRCNQIALSYDWPSNALKTIGFQKLMLRLSMSNPFFIAFDKKWKGIDPETQGWPARRSISFSINATL